MTATLTKPHAARGRGRVLTAGPLAVRVSGRALTVCVLLAAALAVVGAVSLSLGDYHVTVPNVVRALLGQGNSFDQFIVGSLRLPRWLTGLLVGAALGIGGALFQSMSRNPLGSPDIVGFDSGAATGALLVILAWHGSGLTVSLGAVVGGIGTAIVVYVLAMKRGVQGYRLVLVGIGISAMLVSANNYLLTRAELTDAQSAAVWLVGSLNGRTFTNVVPVAIALAVLIGPALWLGRDLRMLELGDDSARALGINAERVRLLTVLVAVGLTAMASAGAGPVVFVALASPQIARRMTGVPGPTVLASALTGALVLTSSDLIAQHVFSTQLPVGAVTGAVGGLYLAWLLSREWRSGRG